MANNNLKPSFSEVSHDPDSQFSEHHSTGSFATLPSGSGEDSVMGSLLDTRMMKVEYNSPTPTNNESRINKRQFSSSEAARYMLVSRNPQIDMNHNNAPQQSKKPRGRPRGSKNKPKPNPLSAIIPTNDTSTPISIVIDVHPGNDVVESLINVAHDRNMGIYVQSGVGILSYAAIRKAPSYAEVHVEGPVTMVALSGSYFPGGHFMPSLPLPPQLHAFQTPPSPTWSLCSSFAVVLSGADSVAYGGIVVGKLIAAEIVRVVAVLVKQPELVRFPIVVDNEGGGSDIKSCTTNNNCDVNNSSLPNYIPAAYGFVGVGTCVCNVGVMQCWKHATIPHANHN